MRQRDDRAPESAEKTVRDIRRATRRHFSAEEKIRIVLEGLRGLSGARDEVLLTAMAQNLRRLAKLVCRPPPRAETACVA